ncbi:Cell surface glycoprotein stim, contains sam domain, partial [Globisporangium splendens]
MARDEKDVVSAFQKLDSDHDSIISLKELDERWEAVGAEMTVSEVADWVAFAVQLPQYASIFRDHSISGYMFPLLMANDGKRLQEIGIDQHLHRQQLAMFLKMKYLGMGKKPAPVVSAVCTAEPSAAGSGSGQSPSKTLLHVAWVPAEDGPQRFQLQRRSPGEATWSLVYTGADTEFIDVVDTGLHVVYRLATWNSYGRSPHEYIRCGPVVGVAATKPALVLPTATASTSGRIVNADALPGHHAHNSSSDGDESADTLFGVLKSYLWWLDEAIALTLFIVLPIRGFIYGDANYVLKIMRRLPPSMPTRVTVEADPLKTSLEGATVTVSWEKPIDNGVPIVCYCVRWTRTKTEEMKWVKLLMLPLPTSVSVNHLMHGETYKFVVEATNEFGLVTKSSRSTYMVPVPELKGKLLPRRSMKEAKVLRNQCHICSDPIKKKKVPFTATLDRRILHFCCLCDQEFCHYHKGEVHHTKALSCPAVDGRCICETCKDIRLQRSATC